MTDREIPAAWRTLDRAASSSPEDVGATFVLARAMSATVAPNPGDLPLLATVVLGPDRRDPVPVTAPQQPPKKTSVGGDLVTGRADYVVGEQIARGGMGVILSAVQTNLRRQVALKKVVASMSDESDYRKFLGEAMVTANLDHPNIPPVYDLGRSAAGELMMSMKLVGGTPWSRLLHPRSEAEKQRAAETPRERHLEILVALCNAVAFAHSKGILHNDLKPQNVMIGEFGEVLLIDWGIAMRFGEPPRSDLPIPHVSDLDGPVGTPNYIAPELAGVEVDKIGPATDVYLLGGLLYEVLTGSPPHQGTTVMEKIYAALMRDPDPLPEDIPDELADICLKALAREPDGRFDSAVEFREALESYLEHRESAIIGRRSWDQIEHCRRLLGEDLDEARQMELHVTFEEAIAGFRQALFLWPENERARRGERQARLLFADVALDTGDLGTAAAQVNLLDDDDEVQALRGRIDAERRRRRRLATRGRILSRLLVAAVVLIISILGSLLLATREAQVDTAQAFAAMYGDMIGKARALYSSEVVGRVKGLPDVTLTHEPRGTGEIPFPATFSIDLARQLSAYNSKFKARLYSDFPFPWRRATGEGGVHTTFEEAALNAVRRDPSTPYVEVEERGGRTYLKYAKAVVLKEGCVGCHNSHPQTPKNDWKVGDVRGVQLVILPIAPIVESLDRYVLRFVLLLALVSGAAVAVLGLMRMMGAGRRRLQDARRAHKVKRTAP